MMPGYPFGVFKPFLWVSDHDTMIIT